MDNRPMDIKTADKGPVGILDSGLGGLTVVNAMAASLPNESIIYVGDTARVPYGEKDVDTIRLYGRQIIGFLQKKGVKAVIVACGTISSNVIEELREEFSGLPLIDVVRPGIDACLQNPAKRIGVIATEATVKSGFFQKKLREKAPEAEVDVRACPLFVPLIEEGWADHIIAAKIVKSYLKDWQDNPIDSLILGCTHYPLLSRVLGKVLKDVKQIDMAVATVETAKKYFSENGMLSEAAKNKSEEFYVSGDVEKFNGMGRQITGIKIAAQKVTW